MGRTYIVEVCPRSEDGHYHACLHGDESLWTDATSIEKAVINLIRDHHVFLKISTEEISRAIFVKDNGPKYAREDRSILHLLMAVLTEKGINLDVRFLLTERR